MIFILDGLYLSARAGSRWTWQGERMYFEYNKYVGSLFSLLVELYNDVMMFPATKGGQVVV